MERRGSFKPLQRSDDAGRRARDARRIHLPHDAGDELDYRNGRLSVGKDLEAVLRKIEHWHQALVTKFRIKARQGKGVWHGVRWDGKKAASFPLNETDETTMRALLLQRPLEEAASASDREIDANQKHVMSDHDKNLFVEQEQMLLTPAVNEKLVPNEVHLALKLIEGMTAEFDPARYHDTYTEDVKKLIEDKAKG
jgi:hypothetical protein